MAIKLEVMPGGRDEIEREMVLSLFRPWSYDYNDAIHRWDVLKPRGGHFISLLPELEVGQSL